MAGGFRKIGYSEPFKKDYQSLDEKQKVDVKDCIKDLRAEVIPLSRRFHCVQEKNPKVFSADIYTDKSYKLTVHIDGDTAVLRRIGTHKEIDRSP